MPWTGLPQLLIIPFVPLLIKHFDVRYIGALENGPATLRDYVQPGDLVLTLGAGTVSRVSDQLLELLNEKSVPPAVAGG